MSRFYFDDMYGYSNSDFYIHLEFYPGSSFDAYNSSNGGRVEGLDTSVNRVELSIRGSNPPPPDAVRWKTAGTNGSNTWYYFSDDSTWNKPINSGGYWPNEIHFEVMRRKPSEPDPPTPATSEVSIVFNDLNGYDPDDLNIVFYDNENTWSGYGLGSCNGNGGSIQVPNNLNAIYIVLEPGSNGEKNKPLAENVQWRTSSTNSGVWFTLGGTYGDREVLRSSGWSGRTIYFRITEPKPVPGQEVEIGFEDKGCAFSVSFYEDSNEKYLINTFSSLNGKQKLFLREDLTSIWISITETPSFDNGSILSLPSNFEWRDSDMSPDTYHNLDIYSSWSRSIYSRWPERFFIRIIDVPLPMRDIKQVWLYDGNRWRRVTPYIYVNGSFKPTKVKIRL